MQTKDYQKQIETGLQTLRTARDEIRVQAHLFGMDVKKRWHELEPRLAHAENAAKQATAASAEAVGSAVQALIDFRKVLDDERAARSQDRPSAR